jgi:hypothetical protein
VRFLEESAQNDRDADASRSTVPGRETRATANGALGRIADHDRESRSVISASCYGGNGPGRKSADGGETLLRRAARALGAAARPALMTAPVRQRHWMEIYDSIF